MFFYHIKIKKGALLVLPVEEDFEASVYILSGKIKSLNEEAKSSQLIHFNMNGDQVAVNALEDSDFIFFGGQTIKEKVVSYGPFVMNSNAEISQAVLDYQNGKLGRIDF